MRASGSSVAFWDWHARIEQHLAGSGVPAVVLRPGFSMANLLGSLEPVRTAGILPLPAGEARVAMIDPTTWRPQRLLRSTRINPLGTYELTGPAAIGFDEVAAALSRSVGREVRYVDVPTEDAVAGMVAGGVPDFAAVQIANVFAALRDGAQAEVTDDLRAADRPFGWGSGLNSCATSSPESPEPPYDCSVARVRPCVGRARPSPAAQPGRESPSPDPPASRRRPSSAQAAHRSSSSR